MRLVPGSKQVIGVGNITWMHADVQESKLALNPDALK